MHGEDHDEDGHGGDDEEEENEEEKNILRQGKTKETEKRERETI